MALAWPERANGQDRHAVPFRRNDALLVEVRHGTAGRPSTSLTLTQAMALLGAAAGTAMEAHVAASLFTGALSGARALTSANIDLADNACHGSHTDDIGGQPHRESASPISWTESGKRSILRPVVKQPLSMRTMTVASPHRSVPCRSPPGEPMGPVLKARYSLAGTWAH